MTKILNLFLRWRLKNKWRKRLKRKSVITLRVENINDFFTQLETRKIRYSSLRWPDLVPYNIDLDNFTNHQIDEKFGDIDLLIELKDVMTLIDFCSVRRKGIKIDLYSVYGSKGMHMGGIPYFPPNKALELLDKSSVERGFSCPPGELYIKSLTYHLTYQKALDSGIPTGITGIESKVNPKKDYRQLLLEESQKHGINLPKEITLINLFYLAKEKGRSE